MMAIRANIYMRSLFPRLPKADFAFKVLSKKEAKKHLAGEDLDAELYKRDKDLPLHKKFKYDVDGNKISDDKRYQMLKEDMH